MPWESIRVIALAHTSPTQNYPLLALPPATTGAPHPYTTCHPCSSCPPPPMYLCAVPLLLAGKPHLYPCCSLLCLKLSFLSSSLCPSSIPGSLLLSLSPFYQLSCMSYDIYDLSIYLCVFLLLFALLTASTTMANVHVYLENRKMGL
jgi:hypothetical protein